jgi:hypothetical protein
MSVKSHDAISRSLPDILQDLDIHHVVMCVGACAGQGLVGPIGVPYTDGKITFVQTAVPSAQATAAVSGPAPLPSNLADYKAPPVSLGGNSSAPAAAGLCGADDRTIIPPTIVSQPPYSNTALVLFTATSPTGALLSYSCSGWQIAPLLVITAGHCITEKGAYTFKSGTAYFGVTGSSYYTGAASICAYTYFNDYTTNNTPGPWDMGLYYLCSPVVQSSYYRPSRLDHLSSYGLNAVVKSYGFPANIAGGGSLVESTGACPIATAAFCGLPSIFSCLSPLSPGMSGGPVVDVASGLVFAVNDFYCTATDACSSGYAPLSATYDVSGLLASFGL